jgi:hypothetical protein
MNINRGMFRLWAVVSILWALVVGGFAYLEFSSPYAFPKEYYYVPQQKAKGSIFDWNKPFYETNFQPLTGPNKEVFAVLDWSIKGEWERNGRIATTTAIQFDDGTLLYVPTEIIDQGQRKAGVKSDGRLIAELFLAQRWQRLFDKVWPWLLGVVLPPILLFFLGLSLIWIIRGFKQTLA